MTDKARKIVDLNFAAWHLHSSLLAGTSVPELKTAWREPPTKPKERYHRLATSPLSAPFMCSPFRQSMCLPSIKVVATRHSLARDSIQRFRAKAPAEKCVTKMFSIRRANRTLGTCTRFRLLHVCRLDCVNSPVINFIAAKAIDIEAWKCDIPVVTHAHGAHVEFHDGCIVRLPSRSDL